MDTAIDPKPSAVSALEDGISRLQREQDYYHNRSNNHNNNNSNHEKPQKSQSQSRLVDGILISNSNPVSNSNGGKSVLDFGGKTALGSGSGSNSNSNSSEGFPAKSVDAGFREDVVACLTRQLLEEQRKVVGLEKELDRQKQERGRGSARALSTLTSIPGSSSGYDLKLDVRLGRTEREEDGEIEHMLDSIDRSLFAQESLNQEAISRYNPNPIRFVDEVEGSASVGGYCRIRKEELEQLIRTYKQSKQDLTNSQILIASLKEKEQKLSTIIEQERSQNTRSIHGSPEMGGHRRRRALGNSPGSPYSGGKGIVADLERSLAEERQNYSNLLESHREYESEIIRLEDELEKEQEYRTALARKYNDSVADLEEKLEEEKLQNAKLKEQYKKLYAFVNKSS